MFHDFKLLISTLIGRYLLLLATLKCFIQCILKLNNKEQKGKSDKRFALNRKVLPDILYKIKLDDAAVAMGVSIFSGLLIFMLSHDIPNTSW